MPRPLLVTADPLLLDELLRLAASAAVEVDVAHDVASARRSWHAAPLVVLGHDLVDRCVEAGLGRRPHLALVGDDLDDAGVWQRAVQVGAQQVVLLPDGEAWLVAALAESAEGARPEGALVALVGGRGGAGASALACCLALVAVRRGLSSVLVDADPWGGGLDMALGGERAPGLRWPDLYGSRGRLPGRALADALPVLHGLPVLSFDRSLVGPLPVEAVTSVLAAARRGADLVVVDLPRSFDEASNAVLSAATTTLLVVPAEVRATAAAAKVAAAAALLCRDLRLVVRGPAPGGLAPSDVVRALSLPLLGSVRAEPAIDVLLDRGEPPGGRPRSPLAALCGELVEQLLTPAGRWVA